MINMYDMSQRKRLSISIKKSRRINFIINGSPKKVNVMLKYPHLMVSVFILKK
ncbi:hypothetical protein D3C75_1370800 [compost metagenome]